MASSNSGSRPSSGRNSSGRPSSGSGRPASGSRSGSGRPSSGRPSSDRSRSTDSRDSRPVRSGGSRDDRPSTGRTASGRPASDRSRSTDSRDSRPVRSGGSRDDRPSTGRTASGRPASDRSRSTDSRDSRPGRSTDSRPARSGGSRDDRPQRGGSDRPYGDRSRSTDSRDSRPARSTDSRDSRSGGSRDDRPARTWSRDDRPKASDDRRPSARTSGSTSGRPASRDDRDSRPGRPSSGGRPGGDRDGRPSTRDGRSPRGGVGRRDDRNDTRRDSSRFTEKRVNANDPIIPDHITGEELDRSVRNELRTLPDGLALRVARHLAASNELALVEPELSWLHAKAALDKAARVGIIREAAAEAAYRAGHFAIALSEFRAAKRINGAREYWPLMADCERALGRPQKAIAMASDPVVAKLERKDRVEMRIVVSGARADQGNLGAALATLKCPELTTTSAEPWAARIRYAYADILEQLGHTEEAIEWFHRAAAVDADELTDADDRIAMLEGTYVEPVESDFALDVIIDVTDDEDDED